MKRIRIVALLLLCLAGTAAAEGDWNYVLKTDGTARLTRYVGAGEPQEAPRSADGFTVTEAEAGLFPDAPRGIRLTPEIPETAGTTEDGLQYAVLEDSCAIVSYTGDAARLIIPRRIEDKPVESILRGAFRNNWTVSHVLLPDTLLEIGDYAFAGCKRLEQIHFDRQVRVIGEYAFYDCDLLERVTLPKDLICIGAYAFAYTPLSRVSLPDSVLLVGESAFDHNPSLSYARLGKNVRVIERYAFAEAPLRRIRLPESVRRVGRGAFAKTAYLTAENAELKEALPDLFVTEADLSTRNWPEPEPEEPLVMLDVDVPIESVSEPEAEPTAKSSESMESEPAGESQQESASIAEAATEEGPQVRITASLAKLRSRPTGAGSLLQYAHTGDTFPFEGREHGWYRLRLPDGQTAYVARGMAEIVGEK